MNEHSKSESPIVLPENVQPELQQLLDEAVAHYRAGRFEESSVCYRQAITIAPERSETYYCLGHALREQGQFEKTVECYRKVLEIQPDFAEGYNNLGLVLRILAQFDAAIVCFRQAISIDADYVAAYYNLAFAYKPTAYDDDIRQMENLYQQANLADQQRSQLAFALGKLFEDLAQYDKAFDYIAAGNRFKRSVYTYSITADVEFLQRQKRIFNKAFFALDREIVATENTPIFILGMFRSGTTLVEQILASHPQVFGAGELDFIHDTTVRCAADAGKTFPECVVVTESDYLRMLACDYIRALRSRAPQVQHISDKMPGNFLYIGFIHLLFPAAKIIHCRRDPMATCWSIFKHNFPSQAHQYAYDLHELAAYYKLYQDIMRHWQEVLPGRIYELQYEDLVGDQETQTRRLLQHCNLPWNDSCLQFHQTARPVKTASALQVRRPLYSRSVEAWRRYEKQLQPLYQALVSGK